MSAVVLSLVLLISTAILLYQFWTGSLLGDDDAVTPTAIGDAAPPAGGARQAARPAKNAA